MERMRARRGFAAGKFRMMRVVTSGAGLESSRAQVSVPIATRATVDTGFPIAESRPVATAAQRRAFGDFQLLSVPRLQRVELDFIMAVETVVVATMRAMTHHDVLVLVGNEKNTVGAVAKRRCFAFFMANIAIKIRSVRAAGKKFRSRNARGRSAEEI